MQHKRAFTATFSCFTISSLYSYIIWYNIGYSIDIHFSFLRCYQCNFDTRQLLSCPMYSIYSCTFSKNASWKNLNFWIFPQCLRLRNPSHSFCLSIQSQVFCWLRKALHIYHTQSHSNLLCSLHRAFSFCKIHFTELCPPFLQSWLFSR